MMEAVVSSDTLMYFHLTLDVTSQKPAFFVVTAVGPSNLA